MLISEIDGVPNSEHLQRCPPSSLYLIAVVLATLNIRVPQAYRPMWGAH